ncbi:hypothetical protein D9M71_143260 [compost metagenome]
MRYPKPADIEAAYTTELCRRVVPTESPVLVPCKPLSGKPLNECFPIVDEHIAAHGGQRVVGWALWERPGVFVEAELHCVWRDSSGNLLDLVPRQIPFDTIVFLPDPARQYQGRQVDNIRQALVDDREVLRFLYLAKRTFEITNAGDLADQHGEIRLPPKAAKEYWKVQKERAQLELRLGRRYP